MSDTSELVGVSVSLVLAIAAFLLTDHYLPVDLSMPGAAKVRKFWAITLFVIFLVLPLLFTLALSNRMDYKSIEAEIHKVRTNTDQKFFQLSNWTREPEQEDNPTGAIVNRLFWELQKQILSKPMPSHLSRFIEKRLLDIYTEVERGYVPIGEGNLEEFFTVLFEGPTSVSEDGFTGHRILAGTNSGATSWPFELRGLSWFRDIHARLISNKKNTPVIWFFVYRSDVPLKVLYDGNRQRTLADVAKDPSGGQCQDGSDLGPEEGLKGYLRIVECIHKTHNILWSRVINGDSCKSVFRVKCDTTTTGCPRDVFIENHLDTAEPVMAERLLVEESWGPKAVAGSRDLDALKGAKQLLVDASVKCATAKTFTMPDKDVLTNFPRILQVLGIPADKKPLAQSITDAFLKRITVLSGQ